MANEKGRGRTESVAIQKCGVVNGRKDGGEVDWNVASKRVTAS